MTETPPTPSLIERARLLQRLVAADIEREGQMASTMVRTGLLADILEAALAALTETEAQASDVGLDKAFPVAGEVFADMDRYKVIFRPGGGSYAGADETVAICSTGDMAGHRTALIARLLNAALSAPSASGEEMP